MTAVLADSIVGKINTHTVFPRTAFSVERGECLAITGPSGSGKTSLLNCVAGLLPPHEGQVMVGGEDIYALPEKQRTRMRLTRMGMVFQFAELVPEMSALENASLPLRLAGTAAALARATATDQSRATGVESLAERYPHELSGGQQQRVGIARALAHGPDIVLADEPTGMLDRAASDAVMEVLREAAADRGCALLIATHDARVSCAADRVLRLDELV